MGTVCGATQWPREARDTLLNSYRQTQIPPFLRRGTTMMPGVQVQEVVEALTEAFSHRELAEMLRISTGYRAATSYPPAELFFQAVSDLLAWAVWQGQEARTCPRGLPSQSPCPKIREIYQKYGMAPRASVQQAGVPIPNAPDTVMADGFEKIVRHLIPSPDLDVWRKKISRVEGWVCRVKLDQEPMGTGFLVGPDTLVTNYHVLKPAIEGRLPWSVVSCQFDYKILADGSRLDGTEVRLASGDCLIDGCAAARQKRKGRPESALPTPDELDYAVVRLKRPVGIEPVDRQARTKASAPGMGAGAGQWSSAPTEAIRC